MKYAGFFAALSILMGVLLFSIDSGVKYFLLWGIVNTTLMAAAYACNLPFLVAKRRSGELSRLKNAINFPWLIFTYVVWYARSRLSSEGACHELLPGTLYLGRRLLHSEALPSEIDVIVDLTAEFYECVSVRHQRNYLSFPILDGGIPTASILREFLQQSAMLQEHCVYVHCAQGHGRTALMAALLLCAFRKCETPIEALSLIQQARPRARVNSSQYRFLQNVDCEKYRN